MVYVGQFVSRYGVASFNALLLFNCFCNIVYLPEPFHPSLTHSLTYLLTYLLTHSLTHSRTPYTHPPPHGVCFKWMAKLAMHKLHSVRYNQCAKCYSLHSRLVRYNHYICISGPSGWSDDSDSDDSPFMSNFMIGACFYGEMEDERVAELAEAQMQGPFDLANQSNMWCVNNTRLACQLDPFQACIIPCSV